MDKTVSNRIFIALMILYALLAGISVFLPQGQAVGMAQAGQLPAPIYVVALASAGLFLVLYGGLGAIGMLLDRKLSLPEIWDFECHKSTALSHSGPHWDRARKSSSSLAM